MPSKSDPIDICNIAMGWLGANSITAFTDNSTEAGLCADQYDAARDAVLEEYEWSFAIKRKQYGSPLSDPDGDYLPYLAYPIDQDYLRILQVASDSDYRTSGTIDWVIEDNKILVEHNPIFVRYLVRVVDTSKFSPMFAQALAARLAADLAVPITESPNHMQAMEAKYAMKLQAAQTADGQQGKSKRISSGWMQRSRTQYFTT